jgi:hypothetical protein
MAEENWERLRTYEDIGAVPQVGPTGIEYTHVYPEHGFSARDLQEGLARYWDVHVINPVTLMDIEIRDEKRRIPPSVASQYEVLKQTAVALDPSGYPGAVYDLAMDFTAGNYAKSYIDLRDSTSSFTAATLFPLAGHFALQSNRPVPFFAELVERAVPYVMGSEEPGVAMDNVWPIWYRSIRNLAVQLHRETTERPFYPASVLMAKGPLKDHPVYYYVAQLLNSLSEQLMQTAAAREYLVPGFEHAPSVNAQLSIDFYTACPGISKFRTLLVAHLAPPCIRFIGGEIWKLRLQHLKESYPNMSQEEVSRIESDLQKVVEQVIDLDERWRRFRLASLGIGEKCRG